MFGSSKKVLTFAPQFRRKANKNRNVAQLVAHYVRDVGVGRSSRLIPTAKSDKRRLLLSLSLYFAPIRSFQTSLIALVY